MDVSEFTTTYEACRGQLKSFVLRMTTSVEETEDILQETYLKAHKNLSGFRGESSLKTWIFAIAANLARDYLRSKKRWPENVTDLCKEAALNNAVFFQEAMYIRMTSPQGKFEIKEHIAFCFTCVSKSLMLEPQLVLMLKEVYGFTTREIGQILSTTEDLAKYHLRQARKKMIEIFDKRCSLVSQTGICHQCTELNGVFNPKQRAEEELVKIKMYREAQKKSKEELFELRMKIMQAIDPFESDAAELQLHHLEHNRRYMEEYLSKKS